MGYIISETEQAAYGDERGAEFSDSTGVGYMGDSANVTQEDMSGVELGYEEPVEQEGQVRCCLLCVKMSKIGSWRGSLVLKVSCIIIGLHSGLVHILFSCTLEIITSGYLVICLL